MKAQQACRVLRMSNPLNLICDSIAHALIGMTEAQLDALASRESIAAMWAERFPETLDTPDERP